MRTIYTWKNKDPEKKNNVATDYSLAVIMMPTTLAGNQIGVIVLHSCPAIVIQTLLFLLLTALAIQAFFKARQISAAEDAAKTKPAESL